MSNRHIPGLTDDSSGASATRPGQAEDELFALRWTSVIERLEPSLPCSFRNRCREWCRHWQTSIQTSREYKSQVHTFRICQRRANPHFGYMPILTVRSGTDVCVPYTVLGLTPSRAWNLTCDSTSKISYQAYASSHDV